MQKHKQLVGLGVLSCMLLGALAVAPVMAQPAQTFPVGEGYLYQEVARDNALAQQFAEITQPLNTHFGWVAQYGVAVPVEYVQIDGKEYAAYQGCKPHDCLSEKYVVLYDEQARKMVAGAFIQHKFEQLTLLESKLSWLNEQSAHFSPALIRLLFSL